MSLGKDEVVYYSYLLLDVLAKSHKLNIIHRDIKFNNIVIDRDLETLKLIDWG